MPFARNLLCLTTLLLLSTKLSAQDTPPNFVIIFCDDLGYGDIGPFGHPTISTPQLDRMAAEGQRWTSFYVGASVCTPSRAALMTGRLPIRSGMCSSKRRVLFPNSGGGLPDSELTIAELLKSQGYATACVGKWHLGHLPQFLPTAQGFDQYFGIPYSNDMDRLADSPKGRQAILEPQSRYYNVPLMRNQEIVERPADQTTITRRYTDEAVRFIEQHQDGPFFLYLAHSMPHVPLFRSPDFEGRSRRGLFGDVIEEIDHSVGRVLDALRNAQLDKNTLVVFTSDNGPWLVFNEHGGTAGLLRGGKGGTFEGGMREPTLFWGLQNRMRPGTVHDMATTMDLLPTFCHLAGVTLPDDRDWDGVNLTPLLAGAGPSTRETVFYYRGTRLYAVRNGAYKAHFVTQSEYGGDQPQEHEPPLLFNLEHDPSEKYNVAAQHADVIAHIREVVAAHQATLEEVPNQLEIPL
ncbi:MAG: sulfatase-like hydrolase/transferase [Planctomycetales bacterium]|nr:sulfatase-like hydrolase/transferase [Planctomycetales bacterium]